MPKFDVNNYPSQKGKIAIVTGANSGIGFETVLGLAQKDIKVIMACRSLVKAEAARTEILKIIPQASLIILELDLSRLVSVRSFAKAFLANYGQLDLLINNAGVMVPPYTVTEDGLELQFASNYLGHFLLTQLLLETLNKTPHSRVVTLSSIAHKNATINFDDLQSEKSYARMKAYGQSKLACLMFAYELQRRLETSNSTTISIAAHPGVSDTNLMRYIPSWLYRLFKPLLYLTVLQKAKNGAEPTLLAALGEHIKGGDYIGPDGFNEMRGNPHKTNSSSLSKNKAVAHKLWDISEKLVKIT